MGDQQQPAKPPLRLWSAGRFRTAVTMAAAVALAPAAFILPALPAYADPIRVSVAATGTITEMDWDHDAEVTITLSEPSDQDIMFNYSVSAATATAGQDFVAIDSRDVHIPAGALSVGIDVRILSDHLYERNLEQFALNLTETSAGLVNGGGLGTTMITIEDTDPIPDITWVGDVEVQEGDYGTSPAEFQIQMNPMSAEPINLQVVMGPGGATSDSYGSGTPDYLQNDTIVQVPAGASTVTVAVPVVGDLVKEDTEIAQLHVTVPGYETGATGDRYANLTITDNDPAPQLNMWPVDANEGTGTPLRAYVNGEMQDQQPFQVTTSSGDTEPGDYQLTPSNTSVLYPGAYYIDLGTMWVNDDQVTEDDEHVDVTVTGPFQQPVTGQVTLKNNADDMPPQVVTGPVTVNESAGQVMVPVSLDFRRSFPWNDATTTERRITVDYTTVDASAGAGDYTRVWGQLVFEPGEQTKTIAVPISDDGQAEGNEQFVLRIDGEIGAGGVAVPEAWITIQDDDSGSGDGTARLTVPSWDIYESGSVEGGGGGISLRVEITGQITQPTPFTVRITPRDAQWNDFGTGEMILNGMINPGDTYVDIGVFRVPPDDLVEPDEHVDITVEAPGLPPATGTMTIKGSFQNQAPNVVADPISVNENIGHAHVPVRLDFASLPWNQATGSAIPITVGYRTWDGSAGPDDYAPTSGQLVFQPGETMRTIPIPITNDGDPEPVEQFHLVLENPDGAGIGTPSTIVKIVDDDGGDTTGGEVDVPRPQLRFDSYDVYESGVVGGPAGGVGLQVYVNGEVRQPIPYTVTVRPTDAEPGDYDTGEMFLSGTIQPGQWSVDLGVLRVPVDRILEADEHVEVIFSADGIPPLTSLVTIHDNNAQSRPPNIVADPVAVDEGSGVAAVPVRLDFGSIPWNEATSSDFPITVEYRTSDGTASAWAGDYSPVSGRLEFPPGVTVRTLLIPIGEDGEPEPVEQFTLTLDQQSGANAVTTPETLVKIIDNDGGDTTGGGVQQPKPQLTIDPVEILESGPLGGTGGGVWMRMNVIGEVREPIPFTVTVRPTDAEPEDYGTAEMITGGTIMPGQWYVDLGIFRVPPDQIVEAAEHVEVVVTADGIPPAVGRVTIRDNWDNQPPNIVADPVAVTEGTGAASVPVRLDFGSIPWNIATRSDMPITVNYRTSDGSASAWAGDYSPVSGQLIFQPGETQHHISIPVGDDGEAEPVEQFTLTLDQPTGAAAVTTQDTIVKIVDNDGGDTTGGEVDLPQPKMTIDPVEIYESGAFGGPGGGIAIRMNILTEVREPIPFTVEVRPTDAEPGDYGTAEMITSGTIMPGQWYVDLGVLRVPPDQLVEPLEHLEVVVTPQNMPPVIGLVTIRDNWDNSSPAVVADSVRLSETAGVASVPVRLDFAAMPNNMATGSEMPVRVNYRTTDGTALAANDYSPVSGQVVFEPGETVRWIPVPLLDDSQVEPVEVFNVVLEPDFGTGAILTPQVSVEIMDDDGGTANPALAQPLISGFTTVDEGGSADVTLSLQDGPRPVDTRFEVHTDDDTATRGTAFVGGNDYSPPPPSVIIPAWQSTATIRVPVAEDDVYERDESFTVVVEPAPGETGVVPGIQLSRVQIRDNDPQPVVTFHSPDHAEGSPAPITATSDRPFQYDMEFDVTVTGDGTGGHDPAEPTDFDGSTEHVVLPGGNGSGTPLRSVVIHHDRLDEGNEWIKVTGHNTTLPGAPVTESYLQVLDDPEDRPPSVLLGAAVSEETDGFTDIPVVLVYDGSNGANSTERRISVSYQAQAGTAGNEDFDPPISPNPLILEPGTTNGTIRVPIRNDVAWEQDENFTVRVTGVEPSETIVHNGISDVRIHSEDAAPPPFSVAGSVRVTESAGQAAVTVTLETVAPGDVDLAVAVRDVTATDRATGPGGDDYDAPPFTMRIPKGERTATIKVPVTGDAVHEPEETAVVSVELAAGEEDAVGGPQQSVVSIEDDDARPALRFVTGESQAAEGGSIPVNATVTGTAQQKLTLGTVSAAGSGDDEAEAADFAFDGAEVTLPAGTENGTTLRLGTLRLNADTVDEATESVRVTLAGEGNAQDVAYRITDDPNDTAPEISVSDATVAENGGQARVDVALALTGGTTATERTVQVPWSTADGTATAGKDYTSSRGTVTFAPGTTSATVSVPVLDDKQNETDQDFDVVLGAPAPGDAEVAAGRATVSIADNDPATAPTLIAPDSITGEGTVTVTGTAGAGSDVALYGAPGLSGGTFKLLDDSTADNAGKFTLRASLSQGYRLRVRADGLNSAAEIVRIRQDASLAAASTVRGTVTLTVTGDPDIAGQTVTVQESVDGEWETVSTGKLAATGRYSTTLRNLRSRSAHTYRATIAATPARGILADTTPNRTIRVS
ncbi:Calx-beta domain-containing protein [Actinoplanes sp. NPDC051861]|uniref:Calx-beta domain-containing protein n=1 Tax=Actinoplanes sp. NPDC051861 TaxID=3155170 RepID=UPI00341F78A9